MNEIQKRTSDGLSLLEQIKNITNCKIQDLHFDVSYDQDSDVIYTLRYKLISKDQETLFEETFKDINSLRSRVLIVVSDLFSKSFNNIKDHIDIKLKERGEAFLSFFKGEN
jgi:hypothetical protein